MSRDYFPEQREQTPVMLDVQIMRCPPPHTPTMAEAISALCTTSNTKPRPVTP